MCVADVSTKAYGAVVYLYSDNNISFVKSKRCVAQALMLPKLELMAVVIATRMAKFVLPSLSVNHHLIPVHLWTVVKLYFHWINNGGHSNALVCQRVTEIRKNFPSNNWSFTPCTENPADSSPEAYPQYHWSHLRYGYMVHDDWQTLLIGQSGHQPISLM